MIVPVPWFLSGIVQAWDGTALVLYIVLPGVAAAAAGATVGAAILDRPARGAAWAAGRGASAAGLAVLLFAPLFAIVFTWTEPGRTSELELTVFVVSFGLIAGLWTLAIAVGALVGSFLCRLVSRSRSGAPMP